MKKIILVRHAAYSGSGPDPILSEIGKEQAAWLANALLEKIEESKHITIWSSTAKRAVGTTQIIKDCFPDAELGYIPKLWSDNDHPHDYAWLKNKLEEFEGEVLIVVTHLEYVQIFPRLLGFTGNNSGYAEGLIIENNLCTMIKRNATRD